MEKGAEFSSCGKYRYALWRIWDESKPIVMCIGLNPSNANRDKDDPTIRILIDTLIELGFGGLRMMNLYALISSKPEVLSSSPDPIGENDKWIETVAYTCQEIIFCWGSFKQCYYRAKVMRKLFPDAKCFGKTSNGSPLHPRALHYKGIKPIDVRLLRFNTD